VRLGEGAEGKPGVQRRSGEELWAWARRFDEVGLAQLPPAETPFNGMLHFTDLDGIALALFWGTAWRGALKPSPVSADTPAGGQPSSDLSRRHGELKRFSVQNETTGVTEGPFASLDEAYETGMKGVRPGDSYAIRMVDDAGSGVVVDAGRRRPERGRRVVWS
jgi:hypothetical protein